MESDALIEINTTTTTTLSVADIQNQIDFIDREIETLENKRAELTSLITT